MLARAGIVIHACLVLTAPARADIVTPGERRRCPEETRPEYGYRHAIRCVPWTCRGSADCRAPASCGEVCQCVEEELVATNDLFRLERRVLGECTPARECERGVPFVSGLCTTRSLPAYEPPRAQQTTTGAASRPMAPARGGSHTRGSSVPIVRPAQRGCAIAVRPGEPPGVLVGSLGALTCGALISRRRTHADLRA